MKNIGFSRKLSSMGYTSHRENIHDSNSTRKIIMLDNLEIKKDKIGQDKTGYGIAKNLSCPSLLDVVKTEIWQDVNPIVANSDIFSIPKYQDI
jgi:hypothetical protein